MTVNREDLDQLTKELRYDLTACQAKLSELRRMLAKIDLPARREPFTCPHCLALEFPTQERLDEHLEWIHEDAEARERLGLAPVNTKEVLW